MALTLVENRKFPRDERGLRVPVEVIIEGRSYSAKATDFSFSGMRLGFHTTRKLVAGQELEILCQDLKLAAAVRHVVRADEQASLGVKIRGALDDEGLMAFTRQDPSWDLIDQAETLKTILDDLVIKGAQAPIEFRQLGVKGLLLPKKLEEDRLLCEAFQIERGKVVLGQISGRFEMFQTCHAFQTQVVEVKGTDVWVRVPSSMARLLRRETFRVPVADRPENLSVDLKCSLLGLSASGLKVSDISEHGFSILSGDGWACLPVNVLVDGIVFTPAKGERISGSGVVRTNRYVAEGDGYAVGFSFETASPEDRTRWHNLILSVRYPSLVFEYREEHHQGIWDLFERSGYLDLKPREAFTHVFDVTKQTWKKLSNAGTSVSKRAVIEKEGKVVGHLQMDRIYPDTWCAHHLAIDPGLSKVVAKELYSVTTDVLSAEGAKYFLSITESTKQWNQRNYYDFVKSYRFPEHHEIRLFHLYRAEPREVLSKAEHPNIQIRPALKWDLKRIARYFELYASELERRACGLSEGSLTLAGLNSELGQSGLSRQREFLVGYEGDKFVGFAQIENGELGVNIFGLLDVLYIHVMPEFVSRGPEVWSPLLLAGLQRFNEMGKQDVLVLLDNSEKEHCEKLGLTFISLSARWIARCEASRRYQAYSQMLFGHLLLQRQRIRDNIKKE